MAAPLSQHVEVYDEASNQWTRGTVVSFLPEVSRYLVAFPDGGKRLLSKEKHVFRFVEAPQAAEDDTLEEIIEESQSNRQGEAQPDAAADPFFGSPGPTQDSQPAEDIDLDALRNEQREYEDWLKAFGQSDAQGAANNKMERTATGSPSMTMSVVSERSTVAPGTANMTTASGKQVPDQKGSAHRSAAKAGATAKEPTASQAATAAGRSVVAVGPSTLSKAASSFLPDPNAPWKPYGFVRSDAAAERIAGSVLLNSSSSSGSAADADASSPSAASWSRSTSGLLSVSVSESRGLAACVPTESGAADKSEGRLSLRVYIIRTPLDVRSTLHAPSKGKDNSSKTSGARGRSASRGRKTPGSDSKRSVSVSSRRAPSAGRTPGPKKATDSKRIANDSDDEEDDGPRLHVPPRINPLLCERNLLYRVDTDISRSAKASPASASSASKEPPIGLSASSSELIVDAAVEALSQPATKDPRQSRGRSASKGTKGEESQQPEPQWPQRVLLACMASPKAVDQAATAAAAASTSGPVQAESALARTGGVPAVFFGASTVFPASASKPAAASLLPFEVDDGGAAPDVRALLDWWHLSGYLLFQVYWEKPGSSAPQAGIFLPPTSVLLAHGLLRVCDVFAGLRWEPPSSGGPLSKHLSSTCGVEVDSQNPALTEFELGVWLPLRPVKSTSASGSSSRSSSATPPALLVQASILLPEWLYGAKQREPSLHQGSGRLSAGGPSGALTAYAESSRNSGANGSPSAGAYDDEEFAAEGSGDEGRGAGAMPLRPGPGSQPPGQSKLSRGPAKNAAAGKPSRPSSAVSSSTRGRSSNGVKSPGRTPGRRPQTAASKHAAGASGFVGGGSTSTAFPQVIYPLTTVSGAAAAQQEQAWLQAQAQQQKEQQQMITLMAVPPAGAFGDGEVGVMMSQHSNLPDSDIANATMRQTRAASSASGRAREGKSRSRSAGARRGRGEAKVDSDGENEYGDDDDGGGAGADGKRGEGEGQRSRRPASAIGRRSASTKRKSLLRGEALPAPRAANQARAITLGRLRNSAKEAMIAGHPSARGNSFAQIMANATKTAKHLLAATLPPVPTEGTARPSTAPGNSATAAIAAPLASVPVFGSPWQALGAQNLPPGIRPDDYKSLKALTDDLIAQRTRLQERLQMETVAATRAKMELAAVKKFHVLLTKEPSPLLNLARARVSTLAASSDANAGAAGAGVGHPRSRSPDKRSSSPSKLLSGGPSALYQLKRRITEAQARVLMLLAQHQRLIADQQDEATAEVLEKERLRREVAALRGRLTAMRERLQRQEALRQVAAASAAAAAAEEEGAEQRGASLAATRGYQPYPLFPQGSVDQYSMQEGALKSAAFYLAGLNGGPQ